MSTTEQPHRPAAPAGRGPGRAAREGASSAAARRRSPSSTTQDKLTARERIDLLIDEGTFCEFGIHAQPHFSQRAMAGREAPADGVITGYGKVDGRLVAVVRLRLHGHGGLDGHDRRAEGRRGCARSR